MFALVVALATVSTRGAAQDAKDKAAPKSAEKTATAEPSSADIKWKFEKDKKVYQEMVTKTTQNLKVMGSDMTQNQEQTFYFSWELKDEDPNGNRTMVQRIDGLKLKLEIAGTPINYDSSNPSTASNALAEFFKQIVGAEFKVTFDKNWKVTKIEGRDEFLKKLGQASPQVEPLLKAVLNDEAFKEMTDPTMGLTTAKPVNKGESWTRDSKLNLGPIGSYKNTYKYTLEGVDNNGIAKVKVDSTLVYEAPSDASAGLPFRIRSAKLASKEAGGTLTFDTKKGRLDKQEYKVRLEGPLDLDIAGTPTTVELKQEQTTTVTTSDQPLMKKS